jgi:TonB family protein
MKNINLIITAALSIFLLASLGIAADDAGFQPNSQGYEAPVLKHSVRPEPVWYAPGKYVEGYVTLELRIGVDGDVEGVKVLYRTSPMAVNSAVQAVEEWKFQPASFNGEAVTSYVAYSLPFGFGSNLQIYANDNYVDRILDPSNGDQIAMR